MAQLNIKHVMPTLYTHEGAVAPRITPLQELIRLTMSCMLWEDNFYEDGKSVAARIKELVHKVSLAEAAGVALEARNNMKLRHVPLLIVREMARHPFRNANRSKNPSGFHGTNDTKIVSTTLAEVIQRPDELTEFLAIYWAEGKQPLSKQVKLGLAKAFAKFNEYQLAKYNRKKDIMLRDVLFLCHSKPADGQGNWTKQIRAAYKHSEMPFEPTPGELLYGKLIYDQLQAPDTWEVELSASTDKLASWNRLLSENKLGDLAFLRNLRNMTQVGVNTLDITASGDLRKWGRVLPFRFIAAARIVPQLEPSLERWMLKCLEGSKKLPGMTVLCIDVSGSMSDKLSGKSDLNRLDAAKALAMLLREVCQDIRVFKFNTDGWEVAARHGFALGDAIGNARGGTDIGRVVREVGRQIPHDRLIVLTDEQSATRVPAPSVKNAYMINVAANRNGVGYGPWLHIDGFSESVVDYIQRYEEAA